MGTCYSVTMKVNIIDEKGAINALNHHIASDARTHYALEKYANIGVTTATLWFQFVYLMLCYLNVSLFFIVS